MAKVSERSVLLIRTGATVWDEAGRLAGSSDLPLCDEGVAQAERLSRVAGERRISSVVCAGDEASQQTARMMAQACGARMRVHKGLSEVGLGLWEGLTPRQLEEKYPKAYKKWRTDPSGVKVPQGEALGDAQNRLIWSLHRALERSRPGAMVGVVLRPLAYGLVTSWIEDRSHSELWSLVRGEPTRVWSMRRERSRLRAGTPRPRLGRAS